MKRFTIGLVLLLVVCFVSAAVIAQQEGGTFTFALAKDAVNMDYIDGAVSYTHLTLPTTPYV